MAVPLDTLLLAVIAVGVFLIWREMRGGDSDDSGESVSDRIGSQADSGKAPYSGAHDSHESDSDWEYEDRDRMGFR